MSAIAEFRLIEISKLSELKSAAEVKVEKKLFSKKIVDNYYSFLDANSEKLKDFDYSGYVFADLLLFLEQKKGIDLFKTRYEELANEISEKRKDSTFIFTSEEREKYLHRLSPDNFSTKELIDFNKDFSENEDPELAKVELEGIKKLLRDCFEKLTDANQVVLLSIG